MKRFHPAASLVVAALSGLSCAAAQGQDMYKWTDENGRVHYGDRAAAPGNSQKMQVTAAPPLPPAPRANSPQLPRVGSRTQQKSMPVDPGRVAPACKGLIDRIAAVPAGKNWESLYREFDSACPGIAYECLEYQSNPQNNRCTWIERSGSNVLSRKRYP